MTLALKLAALLSLTPGALAQGADSLFTGSVEYIGPDLQFQRVLDLDHDGNDEILAAYWTSPMDADQLRFGEVDFDPGEEYQPWTIETPTSLTSCTARGPMAGTAVGDFDGDGFEDFVVALRGHAYVYGTRPDSPPVLLDEIQWSTSVWHLEYLAADLNGDGVDDFVAVGGHMQMWLNDGAGTFSLLAGPTSVGTVSTKVSVGVVDVNGDGAEEIAYRMPQFEWTARRIHIIEPDFAGSINTVQTIVFTLRFAPDMVIGDIDGDLDEDIVVFRPDDELFQVMRCTGTGTFEVETAKSGGPATHFVDLDGDGDLDGLCCGGGSANVCNTDPLDASTYRICLNNGHGNFDVSIARPGVTTGFDGAAGALDIDGDGDLDPVGGRTVLINHQYVGAPYCSNPPNSTGVTAQLFATGSGSLTRSDLVLHGRDLPPHQTALLVLSGRRGAVALGGGTLCLEAPLVRHRVAFADAQGELAIPMPVAEFPAAYPGALTSLATRRFQLWHRDFNPDGFALSEALQVTFAP